MNTEMNKIKVAVIGSCVSRDCFYSKFNPDWHKYFTFTTSTHQNSIISVTSLPVDLPEFDFSPLSNREINEITQECEKKFWLEIKNNKPDIIVVDLFSDARFSIIDFGGRYITDNCWKIGRTASYHTLSKKTRISIKVNQEKYLELFDTALTAFNDKIRKTCPDVTVVLNSPEAAYKYLDENKVLDFDEMQISKFNTLWATLNDRFIKKINPIVIQTSSQMLLGDASHPWGKHYVHYWQEYYTQFLNRLLNTLDIKRREHDLVYESGQHQINKYYNCKLNVRMWAKGALKANGIIISIDAGVYQSGYLLTSAMLRRANGFIQSGAYHLELKTDKHYDSAIYGGYLVDHYGHFLLEGLSRLWALSIIDAPVLFQCPPGLNKLTSLPKYMQEVFELLNISERVILVGSPASVGNLFIPDQSNILDGYISQTYLKSVKLNINASTKTKRHLSSGGKIYLSRSKVKTNLIKNEAILENTLIANGYKIVNPEELSVIEQIKLIENSRILIGFVGSAFHTMVLCSSLPGEVVYLQREKTLNSNFKEIDRALGINARYIDAVTFDSKTESIDFKKIINELAQSGLISAGQV